MKKVLVFTDGKAGHENQSKAFARALGCDCDIVEIHFKSAFKKSLSYLYDKLGVKSLGLFDGLEKVDPKAAYAAVIGTGSGTFYAAKSYAHRHGLKCGVVLYPRGYRISTFDCILAPSFDRPAKAANTVELPVNLVATDAAFYDAGEKNFLERYKPGERNVVAVIVGGPNKCSTMTADWMRAQLEMVFAETADCEHWVTTSRRTPADVEAVVDSFPFDYKLLYSRDHFNPIPAFVKRANRLYVTAESTGMLSEACTFGKSEVIPLDNLNPGPSKFRRFVDGLKAAGYAFGNRKVNLTSQFAQARKLLDIA